MISGRPDQTPDSIIPGGQQEDSTVRYDPIMVRAIIFQVLVLSIAAISAQAQTRAETAQADNLALARRHMQKGEACFDAGDMDCARREFDRAIDSVLELGVDVRSSPSLLQSWREMIERINAYQLTALSGPHERAWKHQEYEGRPPAERVARDQSDAGYELDGPLTPSEFQKRFDVLRERFRDRYGRDIVLTGADHGEHRRLYGPGSAYDIRARDLTREQVKYIIEAGRKLGLRIKDFSTWTKVAAHNARVLSLGRPLDTMATGLHLHIDRMGPSSKSKMTARPVTKKQAKSARPQKNRR
jgi:hypothetical protein